MEISVILPHVEALVFASEKPLTSLELTELINNALGFLDDKITLDQIESAVQGVVEKYNSDFYPFEIRESGGGWQFLTKKDYHKTVAQLNGDKFLKRLSSASLESLAIIAYKQPITKGEVESIRGVNSDYSIQKLLDKELIVITGRNEEMPGKPLVYATSRTFMDYFGINTADELPMIREILASQPFAATPVPQPKGDGLFKDSPVDEEIAPAVGDGDQPLVVRANGELIEEPGIVVDNVTEVVEPEQVIDGDQASATGIVELPEDESAEFSGEEIERLVEESSEHLRQDESAEFSGEQIEHLVEDSSEHFPEDESAEFSGEEIERLVEESSEHLRQDESAEFTGEQIEQLVEDSSEHLPEDESAEFSGEEIEHLVEDEVEEFSGEEIEDSPDQATQEFLQNESAELINNEDSETVGQEIKESPQEETGETPNEEPNELAESEIDESPETSQNTEDSESSQSSKED